jgi:hypothetical protein
MNKWCALLCAGLALAFPTAPILLAGNESSDAERLTYIAPLPGVAKFAVANDIPLEGIDLAAPSRESRPGDRVMLLATLFKGEERRQWLVELQTQELSEAERQKKPPKEVVIYTITGETLRYPTSWSAVSIRISGPYGDTHEDLQPLDRHSRTLVPAAFLSLGFDRWCSLILKLFPNLAGNPASAAGRIEPGQVLSWSGKPYKEEQIVEARRLAEQLGITREDQRLVAGASPALTTFLHIAAKTPGSQEILLQVLEIPSMWSFVRQGGLDIRIKLQGSAMSVLRQNRWNLPMPVYRLPLTLRINGEDALDCTLAVTEPRPPLLACAGILGVSATSPGKKENRVVIRVVATRPAKIAGRDPGR